MDEVKSHNADIKNNYEGTTQKPFFVNKVPGKCGSGLPIIVKINNNYYEAHNRPNEIYLLWNQVNKTQSFKF